MFFHDRSRMTLEQQNGVNLVNKIVMSVAWVACAAFLGSMTQSIHRMEEKLDLVKEVQDRDHATFKVQDVIHGAEIERMKHQLQSLEKSTSRAARPTRNYQQDEDE